MLQDIFQPLAIVIDHQRAIQIRLDALVANQAAAGQNPPPPNNQASPMHHINQNPLLLIAQPTTNLHPTWPNCKIPQLPGYIPAIICSASSKILYMLLISHKPNMMHTTWVSMPSQPLNQGRRMNNSLTQRANEGLELESH